MNYSMNEYISYNRLDLAESLKSEIEILNAYLPEELSEEELNKIKDQERINLIDKWQNKTTTMSISKFSNTKQNNILTQINSVMKDQDRLWRRTYQTRGTKIYLNEDLKSSKEIFNDYDFYQQLVKDAVEYGIQNKNTVNMNNSIKKNIKNNKHKVNLDLVYPKLESFKTPIEYDENVLGVNRKVILKNLFK